MIVKLLITEALKWLQSVMQVSQRLIANRNSKDDNMQMSASVTVHISSAYTSAQCISDVIMMRLKAWWVPLRNLFLHLNGFQENKTLIFAETKRRVDELNRRMLRDQWPCVSIHGDKSQKEREYVSFDVLCLVRALPRPSPPYTRKQ